MHHGIQHLGRHHHRLAGEAAGADDPLLGAGHVLRRHLHPEIAARHHHRIGLLDQLIQMDQRLGLLDLHHDRGPLADQPSRLGDILRALHEGKRDPIAAEIEAELQIGAVLLGQGREAEEDIGQVQPLAVGEMAAGHHDRLGMIGGGGQHREAEASVVEQELGAGLQRGQHLRMGQRRAGRIAQLRREIEAEALAGDEVDAAAVEPADPKLRPLQIDQHADGAAGLRLDLADGLVLAPVIVMGPMAEIEAEDIGAGLDKSAQALRRVAGGAEGGDDLRLTLSSHAAGSTRMARKSLTLVKVGPVTTRSPISGEEAVAVIVGQHGLGVESLGRGAGKAVGARERTRIVLGAVDAVGVAGDGMESRLAIEGDGQRQQEFRIAPAAAHAFDGHRRLAAGDECGRRSRRLAVAADLAGDPGMDQGHVARLALQAVAENDGPVAFGGGDPGGGLQRILGRAMRMTSLPARRGSPGFGVSSLEASLAATAGGGVMAYLAKTARASAKVVGSATVGPEPMTEGSSPGTSEMTNVTTRAGAAAAASLPPLMAERCLRTQFISVIVAPDLSSARLTCCLSAKVRPGAAQCQQCRGAARDQAEHEIIGREPAHRRQDARRRRRTRRVGHGMGGLDDLDMPGGDAMAVARDDEPGERSLPMGLDGARHGGGSLAGAHHHGAALGRRRQKRRDAARRVAGGERGVEHAAQQGARRSL